MYTAVLSVMVLFGSSKICNKSYVNFIIICYFAILGYQHIKMYDLNSSNQNPTINYDGISKNVTAVGFQDDGRWMFTGGEDNSARIWDLR